jgi:magnesium transporter
MVSATISGAIITNYEKVLSSVVILTSFLPMLMDTSGNAGSQSSTLIVRGLATGEIELNDAPKILWKEFRIALTVGTTLAVFNFARLLFIEKTDFVVSALVSVTLIFVVVIAKVIGGILPIAAKKVKLDPAIMAGPLITTIADALSLVVYFSIASAIFKI